MFRQTEFIPNAFFSSLTSKSGYLKYNGTAVKIGVKLNDKLTTRFSWILKPDIPNQFLKLFHFPHWKFVIGELDFGVKNNSILKSEHCDKFKRFNHTDTVGMQKKILKLWYFRSETSVKLISFRRWANDGPQFYCRGSHDISSVFYAFLQPDNMTFNF